MTGRRFGPLWRRIQELWPLFPAAAYLLGSLLVVFLYLVALSLTNSTAAGRVFPTLAPIRRVVSMPEFNQALINTFVFTVVGTPVEVIVGLALALLLYRAFRGRGLVRSIMIIPLAIPTLVTATVLFILFDYPGGHINHFLIGSYDFFPRLIDTPVNWRADKTFALGISLLGKVWRDMPISMLIIAAGLSSVDPELLDAAKTMGAGFRKRVFTVIVPLIIPSISSVILLRSLEMWKEFVFPFVLAGRYNLLGTLIESLYNNWGRSSDAAAVGLILVGCIAVSTGCLLVLTTFLKRRLARV